MMGEEVLKSWKIETKDKIHLRFEEDKEKQWKESFYFIQGADIQFGLISRYLDHDEIITWDKEKKLAEDIVEKINQMNPRPRFFIICGDLCDAMPADDPEMRKKQEIDFKRIFSKVNADIPLICVCGNHDVGDRPTNDTVKSYRNSFGDDYFSFWCGGVWFLVLNSQYFHDSSLVETIAKDQTDWLDECLNSAQTNNVKRVVIFQHIPWFLKTIDEPGDNYFALKPELRQVWLDKFEKSNVQAVFCGHYHRNAGGRYNNIDMVVTSAIGAQLGDDVSGARVVKVLQDSIQHQYYGISDLPLNVAL